LPVEQGLRRQENSSEALWVQ